MKVVKLGGVTKHSGGLYFAVKELANSLVKLGSNITVFGWKEKDYKSDIDSWRPVKVVTYKAVSKFKFSFELLPLISNKNPDIIHLHGLWNFNQLISLLYSLRTNKKLIISPHGMMDEWAIQQSVLKKKLISFLYGNATIRRSHCIHALCKSEYESIRKLGFKNPIAIIPNGIDLPDLADQYFSSKKMSFSIRRKKLVFLGRMHKKKGLLELLDAWRILCQSQGDELDWELVIAGWDDDNLSKQIVKNTTEFDSITYIGSVFGSDKDHLLRSADAFILPSFSEGLPMSVLEAWSYGLPVIMTEHCNLHEGFVHNAAIKVEPTKESIYEQLLKIIACTPEALLSIGVNGRNLVESKFTWDKVGRDMISVYEWCLDENRQIPDCIQLYSNRD
ncbi:glycosyltransferase [Vibrio sp. 1978]|uniref:glycosyltransferase n=1 Tax=Vibrio sp. 1978 TaxID=3074585 RepID=UPI0029675FC8|nr:glycosyltransferase [Vibrio sp. 1978]MDW3056449.1 glycosyltransferase [Vibrio sp. 1978]